MIPSPTRCDGAVEWIVPQGLHLSRLHRRATSFGRRCARRSVSPHSSSRRGSTAPGRARRNGCRPGGTGWVAVTVLAFSTVSGDRGASLLRRRSAAQILPGIARVGRTATVAGRERRMELPGSSPRGGSACRAPPNYAWSMVNADLFVVISRRTSGHELTLHRSVR